MRNFAQRNPGQQGDMLHRSAPAQRGNDVWVSQTSGDRVDTNIIFYYEYKAIVHLVSVYHSTPENGLLYFETYMGHIASYKNNDNSTSQACAITQIEKLQYPNVSCSVSRQWTTVEIAGPDQSSFDGCTTGTKSTSLFVHRDTISVIAKYYLRSTRMTATIAIRPNVKILYILVL